MFIEIQIISILVLKSYSETFGGVVSRQLKKVPNPSVFLLYKTDKCPFQRMSFVSSDNYFKNNSLKTINKDESQPNSCCTFWLIPTCVSSDVCCEMVWPTKWSHTYPALERLLACKYLQWVAALVYNRLVAGAWYSPSAHLCCYYSSHLLDILGHDHGLHQRILDSLISVHLYSELDQVIIQGIQSLGV